MYAHTLATKTASGSLVFDFTQVTTALSAPTMVTAGFRAGRQTRRSRIRQPSLETTAVFGITPSPPGVSRFGPTCALTSALASVAAMAKMLFMRASKQGCRAAELKAVNKKGERG